MPKQETTLKNIPSERLILGGIFQHGNEAFVDVNSFLQTESFTTVQNQQIYECLKLCLANANEVDVPSFYSAGQDLGYGSIMTTKEYVEYLQLIRNTKVNINNIREHAGIVRKLQYARELQDTLRESFTDISEITGRETLSDIQSKAETPIQSLSLKYQTNDESRPSDIGEGIDEYVDHLIENPDTLQGISTGFTNFDHMIGGGLNRQCVDVVVARKKEGKSIFGEEVAKNISSRGIPVFFVDTEMRKKEHFDRLLSNISRINLTEVTQAKFVKDPDKIRKIREASGKIKKLTFKYCKAAGKPFQDVLSEIRRWLLQTVGYDSDGRLNDCVVVYDYFKLTDASALGDLKEYQILGFQMSALKDFCSTYDFPVLTFVQSNREGITMEDSRIVANSDRIMDTATSLTIYKAKTPEEIAEDGGPRFGNKKFVPVMYRHGPGLDNDYVNLLFQGEFASLKELGTRNNMSTGEWEEKEDEEPDEL